MDLMKTELGRLLNRARTLHIQSIWFKVFSDVDLKKRMLKWIQEDQLMKEGIDENGNIIGTYSEITEKINPQKIAGSHYTLFDTGEFYRSMFIVVLSDSFVIDADPIKIDENGEKTNLFEEYGEGIIGLTDESKQKLVLEVTRRFRIELEKIL